MRRLDLTAYCREVLELAAQQELALAAGDVAGALETMRRRNQLSMQALPRPASDSEREAALRVLERVAAFDRSAQGHLQVLLAELHADNRALRAERERFCAYVGNMAVRRSGIVDTRR